MSVLVILVVLMVGLIHYWTGFLKMLFPLNWVRAIAPSFAERYEVPLFLLSCAIVGYVLFHLWYWLDTRDRKDDE